jgi:hypoxanthine phosphoribosyltransferase
VSVAARVVLDRTAIGEHIERLAAAIMVDHPDGVVLVVVLKGALVFSADLARAVRDVPVTLDYLGISRYAPDSGRVRILKDLDVDISGRDVVVVEDLVDTGLTLAYLLGHLREREPRRLEVCTLLDRPARRIVPLEPRYVGTVVGGEAFLLGYGLHLGERYRNLPFVLEVDRDALLADPRAGLSWYDAPPGP